MCVCLEQGPIRKAVHEHVNLQQLQLQQLKMRKKLWPFLNCLACGRSLCKRFVVFVCLFVVVVAVDVVLDAICCLFVCCRLVSSFRFCETNPQTGKVKLRELSKLEDRMLKVARQRQLDNIVTKQVVWGKEFKVCCCCCC